MAVQKVMDHTGHTTHEFDPKTAVSVAEAEARFKELTGKGFQAAVLKDNGDHEIVRAFDSNAEQTVFIPQLQGG